MDFLSTAHPVPGRHAKHIYPDNLFAGYDQSRLIMIGQLALGRVRLPLGSILVLDVGKTLSKVTLWSPSGVLLDRKVRPNEIRSANEKRVLDVDGIQTWLVETLAGYADRNLEAIVPVGHGAGLAALRDGTLAYDPFDYEQPIPSSVMESYRANRDLFTMTGSPALPNGLNAGCQLFWMEGREPAALEGATLIPWAQYWAWFLSGSAATEVSSLGCHTDLWCPSSGDFSPMAKRLGWADKFAPLALAWDRIGTLRPELARQTGLSQGVAVLAGLHDSNAALLAARGFAEIADSEATVLSTGTWFIAMRLPAYPVETANLPNSRDCLVNVDVFGNPVPSARFMGGREIESIIEIDTRRVDIKPDQPALLAAVPSVLREGSMILPTLAKGFGPFPDRISSWVGRPDDWYARRAAACLYAALVTDVSLNLIGTRERILVEGRFAEAEVFVRALAALRPDHAIYTANAHNDVSFGALRLIHPELEPAGALARVKPLDGDLDGYRRAWRDHLEVAS